MIGWIGYLRKLAKGERLTDGFLTDGLSDAESRVFSSMFNKALIVKFIWALLITGGAIYLAVTYSLWWLLLLLLA